MKPRTKLIIVLSVFFGVAAVFVAGMIALMVWMNQPDTGVRFQAYAGECPMDVTFTIGTYTPVSEKNVLGMKTARGVRNAWYSGNYEVPSGTKLSMRATASCKSLHATQPQCEIRYQSKKLVGVPSTGNAACSAEATAP